MRIQIASFSPGHIMYLWQPDAVAAGLDQISIQQKYILNTLTQVQLDLEGQVSIFGVWLLAFCTKASDVYS